MLIHENIIREMFYLAHSQKIPAIRYVFSANSQYLEEKATEKIWTFYGFIMLGKIFLRVLHDILLSPKPLL